MNTIRLTGINEWFVVHVVTMGAVAAFKDKTNALDYADSMRDVIGEARGLSVVSVRDNATGLIVTRADITELGKKYI